MEQLKLFPEISVLEPYPWRYFPIEAAGALGILFYQGAEKLGDNQLLCPYHDKSYTGQAMKCDCPDALHLLIKLGRGWPKCSRTRCPVRLALQLVAA